MRFVVVIAACAAVLGGGWTLREVRAASEDLPPVHLDVESGPARQISEYNLFRDPARQIPNDGVLPYDLNTPLFSDYSHKDRFVWMPPGSAAAYVEDGVFEFPIGTILVKTFSFPHDMRAPEQGRRIVETRLLIHKPQGWVAYPYIWNEDVTEARLAVVGGRADVSWVHYDGAERSINYLIPNMNQCKMCHERDKEFVPIGPQAMHLNKLFDYGEGTENQLARWVRAGYLEGAPEAYDDAPRVPRWDDPGTGSLADRARAWLDINCAHCHNPAGPAASSGLDLSYLQDNPFKFGVQKPPVAAGRASGDMQYSIVPGEPDRSILVHRIESTDPAIMMPQLPRRLVHDEGVALVREWITEMQ